MQAAKSSSLMPCCGLMETSPFHALRFDGETLDTGSKTGYLRAAAAYGLANLEHGAEVRRILEDLLKG